MSVRVAVGDDDREAFKIIGQTISYARSRDEVLLLFDVRRNQQK